MGVYIPNGGKPKDCNECWALGLHMIANCKSLEWNPNGDKMPSDCPLIEVKAPHGRLIDADVCKQRVYDGSRTPYKGCPTVIEAEVE